MTGDDDLSQINELTLYHRNFVLFRSMLYKSFGHPFMPRNQISRQRGRGVLGLQPRHLRLCKDQSNVGTKMASADNNLKSPFMSID